MNKIAAVRGWGVGEGMNVVGKDEFVVGNVETWNIAEGLTPTGVGTLPRHGHK